MRYSSSDSQNLIVNFKATLGAVEQALAEVKSADLRLFSTVGAPGMKGKAYEAGRDFFAENIVPVVAALEQGVVALQNDLQRYQQADQRVNKYGKLDAAALQETKDHVIHIQRTLQNQIEQEQYFSRNFPLAEPVINLHLTVLRTQQDKWEQIQKQVQRQLADLQQFDAEIAGLFSSADDLLARVERFSIALNATEYTVAGDLKLSKELASLKNELLATAKYRERAVAVIAKIAGDRSPAERDSLITQLTTLIEQLLTRDGWDMAAVREFLAYLETHATKEATTSKRSMAQMLNDYDGQIHAVGSSLYTKMYTRSKLTARAKVELVLIQLGTYVDKHNFMQLAPVATYKLANDLAPMDDFLVIFRSEVLKVFGKATKKQTIAQTSTGKNSLEDRIHLFRSYLGKQSIDYLRSRYTDKGDDLARLKAYVADYNKQHNADLKIDWQTGDNYHNRSLQQDKSFIPVNAKAQLAATSTNGEGKAEKNNARMSEFIINASTGNFVSEWDVYRKNTDGTYDSDPEHYQLSELAPVANTESFNYGIPSGKGKVSSMYRGSHIKLDVEHTPNNDIRRKATKQYKSQPSNYADIVNAGGEKDIAAWQKIVASGKEQEVYRDFVKWVNEKDANEIRYDVGFDQYSESLKKK